MSTYLQDLDDVRAVIQLYIDGANGDVAKLKQAFHADARMFGHIGPMDTYVPISDFFAMVQAQPGMAGPKYKATVRASISLAMQGSPCSSRPITSVATSSITSRWRASTAVGSSPTRVAHTGGRPPHIDAYEILLLTATPSSPCQTTERTRT